jgi:hypothetical protein
VSRRHDVTTTPVARPQVRCGGAGEAGGRSAAGDFAGQSRAGIILRQGCTLLYAPPCHSSIWTTCRRLHREPRRLTQTTLGGRKGHDEDDDMMRMINTQARMPIALLLDRR